MSELWTSKLWNACGWQVGRFPLGTVPSPRGTCVVRMLCLSSGYFLLLFFPTARNDSAVIIDATVGAETPLCCSRARGDDVKLRQRCATVKGMAEVGWRHSRWMDGGVAVEKAAVGPLQVRTLCFIVLAVASKLP